MGSSHGGGSLSLTGRSSYSDDNYDQDTIQLMGRFAAAKAELERLDLWGGHTNRISTDETIWNELYKVGERADFWAGTYSPGKGRSKAYELLKPMSAGERRIKYDKESVRYFAEEFITTLENRVEKYREYDRKAESFSYILSKNEIFKEIAPKHHLEYITQFEANISTKLGKLRHSIVVDPRTDILEDSIKTLNNMNHMHTYASNIEQFSYVKKKFSELGAHTYPDEESILGTINNINEYLKINNPKPTKESIEEFNFYFKKCDVTDIHEKLKLEKAAIPIIAILREKEESTIEDFGGGMSILETIFPLQKLVKLGRVNERWETKLTDKGTVNYRVYSLPKD